MMAMDVQGPQQTRLDFASMNEMASVLQKESVNV